MADEPTEDFEDLDDLLVPEPKRLPIRGKEYEFPADISGRALLLIERSFTEMERASRAESEGREYDARRVVLDDQEEVDLRTELFGDAADEMARDGLPASHLQRVMFVLMVWHVAGRDAALRAWRGRGETPAPNRAARRAAASTTRRPDSTSGTSPSRKGRGSRGAGS